MGRQVLELKALGRAREVKRGEGRGIFPKAWGTMERQIEPM